MLFTNNRSVLEMSSTPVGHDNTDHTSRGATALAAEARNPHDPRRPEPTVFGIAKPNGDIRTTSDNSNVYKMDPPPSTDETAGHLSHVDFEQGEEIELTGNTDIEQYSRLQYFSTQTVFKDRLKALTGWANKTDLDAIYVTITINENFLDGKFLPIDSVEDAIAEFEDLFIKNIRVPRKYTPPVGNESKKRESDHSDYENVKGNFDLACRIPGTEDNPHILEFILYDCSDDDALKKIKTFEGFARDLGLSAKVKAFHNSGQSIWNRNPLTKFFQLLIRKTNRYWAKVRSGHDRPLR